MMECWSIVYSVQATNKNITLGNLNVIWLGQTSLTLGHLIVADTDIFRF